jgi:hypothetical protein
MKPSSWEHTNWAVAAGIRGGQSAGQDQNPSKGCGGAGCKPTLPPLPEGRGGEFFLDILFHRIGYCPPLYCHGRGRRFESRRPRHAFQKSYLESAESIGVQKSRRYVSLLHPNFIVPHGLGPNAVRPCRYSQGSQEGDQVLLVFGREFEPEGMSLDCVGFGAIRLEAVGDVVVTGAARIEPVF